MNNKTFKRFQLIFNVISILLLVAASMIGYNMTKTLTDSEFEQLEHIAMDVYKGEEGTYNLDFKILIIKEENSIIVKSTDLLKVGQVELTVTNGITTITRDYMYLAHIFTILGIGIAFAIWLIIYGFIYTNHTLKNWPSSREQ